MSEKISDVKCPTCSSDAIYRYGRISSGKRRLRCILCGRQFVVGAARYVPALRPTCPKCGLKMHLYMRGENLLRFRCSDYPQCKSYSKITLQSGGLAA
jgi:ssDNA-binding Zn-finger/Zn-ribbon topoisomerase 1